MNPKRLFAWHAAVLVVGLLLIAGCGSEASKQELGKLIYQLPKLPGSDQPYPLPPLDESAAPASGSAAPAPRIPTR